MRLIKLLWKAWHKELRCGAVTLQRRLATYRASGQGWASLFLLKLLSVLNLMSEVRFALFRSLFSFRFFMASPVLLTAASQAGRNRKTCHWMDPRDDVWQMSKSGSQHRLKNTHSQPANARLAACFGRKRGWIINRILRTDEGILQALPLLEPFPTTTLAR